MISLQTLAENLQTGLNTAAQDDLSFLPEDTKESFSFRIVADTGLSKAPVRLNSTENSVTKYINGVLSLNSSSVDNTQTGLLVAVMKTRLELVIECEDYRDLQEMESVGNVGDIIVNRVRKVLDNYFQNTTVQEMLDSSGVHYIVSKAYAFANSGARNIRGQIGDSYTLNVNISYGFVQNGVNSRSWSFVFDSSLLPFQDFAINRVSVNEANVYSDNKKSNSENDITSTSLNLTLNLPMTTGNFGLGALNHLLTGDINVHILAIQVANLQTELYLVVYSDETAVGETIKNVGMKINLIESTRDYSRISFPSQYEIISSSLLKAPNIASTYFYYSLTFSANTDIYLYVSEKIREIAVNTSGYITEIGKSLQLYHITDETFNFTISADSTVYFAFSSAVSFTFNKMVALTATSQEYTVIQDGQNE